MEIINVLIIISSLIIFGLIFYKLGKSKSKKEYKKYLETELSKNPNRRGFYSCTFNVPPNTYNNKTKDSSTVEYVFEEIDNTNNKSKVKIIEVKCLNLKYSEPHIYEQYKEKFENSWIDENDIAWFTKDENRKTKLKLEQLLKEVS